MAHNNNSGDHIDFDVAEFKIFINGLAKAAGQKLNPIIMTIFKRWLLEVEDRASQPINKSSAPTASFHKNKQHK